MLNLMAVQLKNVAYAKLQYVTLNVTLATVGTCGMWMHQAIVYSGWETSAMVRRMRHQVHLSPPTRAHLKSGFASTTSPFQKVVFIFWVYEAVILLIPL